MLNSINFLPHGTQIIPGLETPYNQAFKDLHQSMQDISESIFLENSELIILITPHGYSLEENFLLYTHDKYQAFHYKIESDQQLSLLHGELISSFLWEGDKKWSEKLYNHLINDGLSVNQLIQGAPVYPLTLGWGESVPLYYLLKKSSAKVVIIGIPRQRHSNLAGLTPKLNLLSQSLVKFCNNHPAKVSLVFSGDLSHTHQENGPYGFDKSSKDFDQIVNQWVKNRSPKDMDALIQLQPSALACGMAALIMIQDISNITKLFLDYSYYKAPSYFGMIICKWKLNP